MKIDSLRAGEYASDLLKQIPFSLSKAMSTGNQLNILLSKKDIAGKYDKELAEQQLKGAVTPERRMNLNLAAFGGAGEGATGAILGALKDKLKKRNLWKILQTPNKQLDHRTNKIY